MDDIVKEFLVESCENLDRLDQDFLALERDHGPRERFASIFRTIHTIKGTCGFLGLSKLESVTHVGESVLSKLRDGQIEVTSEIISALLSLVDAVREILGNIERGAGEGEGNYAAIIATLTQINDGASTDARPAAAIAPDAAPAVAKPAECAEDKPQTERHEEPTTGSDAEHVRADSSAKAVPAANNEAGSISGIRVDVTLVDKLMNLVGELVLARNQILQFGATTENATLANSTQRLNLITTELQENVMKTRMQPIGTVWNKFPRIVRDLAKACGKEIRVDMEGQETEL